MNGIFSTKINLLENKSDNTFKYQIFFQFLQHLNHYEDG